MTTPNKFLLKLLDEFIFFDCAACKRFWLYRDFRTHASNGKCVMDPNAANNIDKLKIRKQVRKLENGEEGFVMKDASAMAFRPTLARHKSLS